MLWEHPYRQDYGGKDFLSSVITLFNRALIGLDLEIGFGTGTK